jgi:hypothetical protein
MPPDAAQSPPANDLPTPPGRPGAPTAERGAPAYASAAIPESPPPEVLDAMAVAADAYDRLKTAGRRLHFEADPDTGRLTVQVLDPDGNVVTTLPPSKVLDLASGGALD